MKNKELENKTRFFAQYWGQKYILDNGTLYWTVNHRAFPVDETACLELKALSEITDEDAVTVKELVKDTFYFDEEYDTKQLNRAVIRMITEHTGSWLHVGNCMYAIDYLRSKGYALPFMEYSIEDLINKGWIRLCK